jgi:hypothetical protein
MSRVSRCVLFAVSKQHSSVRLRTTVASLVSVPEQPKQATANLTIMRDEYACASVFQDQPPTQRTDYVMQDACITTLCHLPG